MIYTYNFYEIRVISLSCKIVDEYWPEPLSSSKKKLGGHNIQVCRKKPWFFARLNRSSSKGEKLPKFTTVEPIPRSFHSKYEPNSLWCFLLPLPAILGSKKIGLYKISAKLRNTQVFELFRYHPDGHFLSIKPLKDVSIPLKLVSNKFFRVIDRNHVGIQDFFYD
ncbi:hypothetical protein BY458DRAFT_547638 [Sporodiniella umbellata]|nr:hypothetical protein BY458DRAFT_547638 [Sporodiniella umbellata]